MIFVILCCYLDKFVLLFTKGFTKFDPPIVKANLDGTCLLSELKKEQKKLQSRKN